MTFEDEIKDFVKTIPAKLEHIDTEDKRKINTFERCTKWRGNDIKIVFQKDYSRWSNSNCWLIRTIIERG